MADAWGVSWGSPSAWGISWVGSATTTATTPDVGGIHGARRRRKRWLIDGKHLLLDDDELYAYLKRLLAQRKPVAKPRPAAKQPEKKQSEIAVPSGPGAVSGILSAERSAPTYQHVPLFDHYWAALWAREQPELQRMLREAAMALEQEEDDIETLLLSHD